MVEQIHVLKADELKFLIKRAVPEYQPQMSALAQTAETSALEIPLVARPLSETVTIPELSGKSRWTAPRVEAVG
jgi:hypothetical protein